MTINTQSITEAENLIEIIMLSKVLTDAQKETFMKDIVAGHLPEYLEKHWDEFLANENDGIESERQELNALISLQAEESEQVSEEIATVLPSLMTTHEKKVQEIHDAFVGTCNDCERTLNQDLQAIVHTHKDTVEADAIRASLQQK